MVKKKKTKAKVKRRKKEKTPIAKRQPKINKKVQQKAQTKESPKKSLSISRSIKEKKEKQQHQDAFARISSKKAKLTKSGYATDKQIEDITKCLRVGAYIETAIVMAGIPKKVFYHFMAIANGNIEGDHIEKHMKLRDSVYKAVEECTIKDLESIDINVTGRDVEYLRNDDGSLIRNNNGSPIIKSPYIIPNWKAAAWRLSRRFPGKWGGSLDPEAIDKMKHEHEHTHSIDGKANELVIKFVHTGKETKDNIVETGPMDDKVKNEE